MGLKCSCGSLSFEELKEDIYRCTTCRLTMHVQNIEVKNSDEPAIFENTYHCWRKGRYIGRATFKDDENIGCAFISMSVSPDGELIHEVYIPDKFVLV